MDSDSGGDHEISVTLSPPLREWIAERSSALGIPQAQLLEQLLAAHRDVAERDGDVSTALSELADIESAVERALDDRLEPEAIDTLETDIEDTQGQVDELDAKLTNHVEDLRSRVLQLRDSVSERAPADHSHEELELIADRLEVISEEIGEIDDRTNATDETLWWISTEIGSTTDRLETVEDRIDRLARAVVALKRHRDASNADTQTLNGIKKTANQRGTRSANCENCSNTVQIELLSEPFCPHCDRRVDDLTESDSFLGRFRTPTLTVAEDPTTNASERSEPEDK